MKLIHLPTGEEVDFWYIMAINTLDAIPNNYIRAELPEYWRVEGYDKSWEWFENSATHEINGKEYDWISNNERDKKGANAWDTECKYMMDTPQISRAEFEHHIYNPWKGEQAIREHQYTSKLNKDVIGSPATPYIKTHATAAGQVDMSDVDKLREAAEKMGFELVRKPIVWEGFDTRFRLDEEELTMESIHDGSDFSLYHPEIETLIEKYNQFKSNS